MEQMFVGIDVAKDRLVQAKLVMRSEAPEDRRRVLLSLTPTAETTLAQLSAAHLDELRHSRALLAQLLERIDAA
jgi:DNA-binding MarR family transcriptional regulator